jgi:hypothetical protein
MFFYLLFLNFLFLKMYGALDRPMQRFIISLPQETSLKDMISFLGAGLDNLQGLYWYHEDKKKIEAIDKKAKTAD